MTKKDYVKIAALLAETDTASQPLAERFAEMLKRDNAAFDRERFLAACKKAA